MTIQEARQTILIEIKDLYEINEAANIAELVLEKITEKNKLSRAIEKEKSLSPNEIEELKKIISRLKINEPVQYVLEEAWFAGMKFKVNKSVLIPRPETEELADWVTRDSIKNNQYSINNNQFSILDIGTGSGCIPITIKKKLPGAVVTAIDVCSDALFIATENAIANETEIEFTLLDFLDENKWKVLGNYDVIVSNPPYVKQSEKQSMHLRVTDHEPQKALFVPDEDALIFYKKLADFSLLHLNPKGKLFVEINEALGDDVVNLFQQKGFNSIELKKDMQGKDRFVKAVKSW